MEDNKANKPEYIENQVNNNCQQFFGNMYNCVFTMPGDDNAKPEPASLPQIEEELFRFIHPKITDEKERREVHQEVKNLVKNYPMPNIFNHLDEMAKNERVYYKTLNHAIVRAELERLGLPDESQPGYTTKTFDKHFH